MKCWASPFNLVSSSRLQDSPANSANGSGSLIAAEVLCITVGKAIILYESWEENYGQTVNHKSWWTPASPMGHKKVCKLATASQTESLAGSCNLVLSVTASGCIWKNNFIKDLMFYEIFEARHRIFSLLQEQDVGTFKTSSGCSLRKAIRATQLNDTQMMSRKQALTSFYVRLHHYLPRESHISMI